MSFRAVTVTGRTTNTAPPSNFWPGPPLPGMRRHEATGLVVTDLLRKAETWLIDERPGGHRCGRHSTGRPALQARKLAMSGGVMVAVDAEMLERVIAELLVSGYAKPARMADEPRKPPSTVAPLSAA